MFIGGVVGNPVLEDYVVACNRIRNSNLGSITFNASMIPVFSNKSEALSLNAIDGFDVFGNVLENTFMEGITFKPGCLNGKIRYNTVRNCRAVGIYANAGSDTEIYRNLVENTGYFDDGLGPQLSTLIWESLPNTTEPLSHQGSTAILVQTGDVLGAVQGNNMAGIDVYENVILRSVKNGIVTFDRARHLEGVPPAQTSMVDIHVFNNVIYGACQNPILSNATGALVAESDLLSSSYSNNIVVSTGSQGVVQPPAVLISPGSVFSSATTSWSHVLLFANPNNGPSLPPNTLLGDPVFRLTPVGFGAPFDFALEVGSPAIDSGSPQPSLPLWPASGVKDRGAYEYGAAGWFLPN